MRRQKPRLTPDAIRAALAFQAVRTARTWRVHWLHIPPTLARYPVPVCLARVLSEHHAAVSAEPFGE